MIRPVLISFILLALTACLGACRSTGPTQMETQGVLEPTANEDLTLADGATLGGITAPGVELADTTVTDGEYQADSLYAIPEQTEVSVGDPVRIVVATGVPANAFHFMNCVRVTFSGGDPEFVETSLNVGAPGGSPKEADGIWATSGAEGFLVPDDFMMAVQQDSSNRSVIDFNVTPIVSRTLDGLEGELFNFQVRFNAAGTVRLGFSRFDAVKRSYYSDADGCEYSWGNIGNDYGDYDNAIRVLE
ncbi:hypothetical protein JW859_06845 [bacterium]|nr:hypothetical protein [bacterium]